MSASTMSGAEIAVPARAAAVAWLNAFLATSDDEARIGLYKCLAIEVFPDGVQFIAVNGHLLLRTWAPREEGKPWPDIAEDPDHRIVVMDIEGFAVGFMRTLLKATNEDGNPHAVLHLSTSPADEGATLLLGEQFMSERLSLRACGQRIDLKLFEGDFSNWRQTVPPAKRVRESTERITIDPSYLGILGKLRDVSSVHLEFHGRTKAVLLEGRGVVDMVGVHGLLMPLRGRD